MTGDEFFADAELDAQVQAARALYPHFVATQPIYHDGQLAFEKDDPIPVANVVRDGYEAKGWVRRVGAR
jgi:hypothetical protein